MQNGLDLAMRIPAVPLNCDLAKPIPASVNDAWSVSLSHCRRLLSMTLGRLVFRTADDYFQGRLVGESFSLQMIIFNDAWFDGSSFQ